MCPCVATQTCTTLCSVIYTNNDDDDDGSWSVATGSVAEGSEVRCDHINHKKEAVQWRSVYKRTDIYCQCTYIVYIVLKCTETFIIYICMVYALHLCSKLFSSGYYKHSVPRQSLWPCIPTVRKTLHATSVISCITVRNLWQTIMNWFVNECSTNPACVAIKATNAPLKCICIDFIGP